MRRLLPLLAVAAALLAGCAASPAVPDASSDTRASVAPTTTPTPTAAAAAPVAPVVPAAPLPLAPVTAPAPASVDYVTPVTNRWGGCFSRLGVGDIYYDSVTGTVTGGWNGGVLTWSVGPGNTAGTPADQQSVDALAGC